jgi:hypothetical protein
MDEPGDDDDDDVDDGDDDDRGEGRVFAVASCGRNAKKETR